MLADKSLAPQRRPWDYWHENFWCTYWFERVGPQKLLETVGVNKVLFETDFPHPTALYPNVQEHIVATLGGYVSQQIQYSLLNRDAECELLSLGVHEQVGALIWEPLASGFLTGKFRKPTSDEPTRLGPRAEQVATEQANSVLDAREEIAASRPGATASQVALDWIVRKAGVSSIIVGARTVDQLAGNLAAASWSLADEEIARLDAVSEVPLRYPYVMHRVFTHGRNPTSPLLPIPS
jgi:diketogulonate reductase-like aldo/keto reductase